MSIGQRWISKQITEKNIKGKRSAWINFLKPAANVAAPFIGMADAAKSKNTYFGQASTNFLKFMSGGKILSVMDMHEKGSH